MIVLQEIIQRSIIKKEKGVIFLSEENNSFEEIYVSTRKKEGWLYTAESAKRLPDVSRADPFYKLWKIRKQSAHKFITYLKKKNAKTILEVGCGNGWFTNTIAENFPGAACVGLDINKQELSIAAEAFQKGNIYWVYGNVFEELFKDQVFDLIVLNASLQYFPDFTDLIHTLLNYLSENGEIHLLDSPMYTDQNSSVAKQATIQYYETTGKPEMEALYFHHTWSRLTAFQYHLLYKPSFMNKLKSKIVLKSFVPFPWIVIRNEK